MIRPTPAEIRAGVMPVDSRYRPGHLWRYGGNPDGTTDNSAAFAAAAAYLSAGGNSLHIPAGRYLMNDGRFDVDAAPNGCTIYGDGRNSTRIVTDDGATQCPFVVRNTNGVLIFGIGFESIAEDSLYQHNCEVMNCSKVTIEFCSFNDAGGYGFGCYQDTLASPDVAHACNEFVFRFNVVRNASQYGLQHFPKVRSNGCWVYGNLFVDCGKNRKGDAVPDAILPSAIKAGQATGNSHIYDNTIFAASNAAGLDVGNFEDVELHDNQVYNCTRQFLAVSVAEHSSLLPFVPAHRRMVARDNTFVVQPGAGTRAAPAITFASDATTRMGLIRFEHNYIEGDDYSPSMEVKPSGAMNELEILSMRWRGSFSDGPAIILHLSDSFGGTITAPLIQDIQIVNDNLNAEVLRAIQIEGAVRPRIIGGYIKNLGDNAIDLRDCAGGAVVSGIEIDGYNLQNNPRVAAIAVTDSAANDYHIEHVKLRPGKGSPKALLSASTTSPKFSLLGNQLPSGVPKTLAGVTLVENESRR